MTNCKLRTNCSNFLTFVRFSHTLFALPFALGSMVVAAHGWPGVRLFWLILGCMVFARTAAMSFNRIVDWEIDQRNPRTAGRHTLLKKSTAMAACGMSALLFVSLTAMINHLCLLLSPLALLIVFFYSLTKRFTSFAQFFLGLALAVSPVGAWIAVQGNISLPPLMLAAGVICWVAGFDMIYATQDVEIDRKEGLYSMVVWLGVPHALRLAGWLHGVLFIALIGFGETTHQNYFYYLFLIPVPLLLAYEHRMAKNLSLHSTAAANSFVVPVLALSSTSCTLSCSAPSTPASSSAAANVTIDSTVFYVNQINKAFFQTNVLVGFLFLLATCTGLFQPFNISPLQPYEDVSLSSHASL